MDTSPQSAGSHSRMWILWAVVGGAAGWAIGFLGFAIHCAVFIPGPIPFRTDGQGPDRDTPVTAYTQIYGRTIHEETGPFGEVLAAGSRRTDLIAWPVVGLCIVAGALAGGWLWRRMRRRK